MSDENYQEIFIAGPEAMCTCDYPDAINGIHLPDCLWMEAVLYRKNVLGIDPPSGRQGSGQ